MLNVMKHIYFMTRFGFGHVLIMCKKTENWIEIEKKKSGDSS